MTPISLPLSGGSKLFAIQTDTFKTNILVMGIISDMSPIENLKTTAFFGLLSDTNANYPTKGVFNAHLEDFYGMNFFASSSGYKQRLTTIFGAEFLSGRYLPDDTDTLGEAITLLHDAFYNPVLDDDGLFSKVLFDRLMEERAIARERRRLNPPSRAFLSFQNHLLADIDEVARLVSDETFWNSLTREEVTALWKKTQSLPMAFFYVGEEAPELVQRRIEEAFIKDLPQAEIVNNFPPLAITRARNLRIEEDYTCQQGQLILGYTTGVERGEEGILALGVANEILGGGNGKLFRNVREKKHLCYSCFSSHNLDRGTIIISAGIDSSKREQAEKEILKQVEALKKGDFTDGEFMNAKLAMANTFLTVEDSPSNLYAYYYERMILNKNKPPMEVFQKFMDLTKEEVVASANKMQLDVTYFQKAKKEG